MINVTIRPHVVGDTKFDQFQVLIGQRVVGYKVKGKPPKLVVRDLPEDALNAIAAASAEMDGVEAPDHTTTVSQPIGSSAPTTDAAESK